MGGNYAAQHKWLKLDAHPVHAVVVSDLQLLLCLLEAGMFVVIGRGFKVDIHIISWHCKERERISRSSENCDLGLQRTGRERNLHACIINNLADRVYWTTTYQESILVSLSCQFTATSVSYIIPETVMHCGNQHLFSLLISSEMSIIQLQQQNDLDCRIKNLFSLPFHIGVG